MSYPSPPWQLNGCFLQSLQPLAVEDVRSLIPAPLEIVSIFPGKTLGGIYLSFYDDTSILSYSELVVVPAIVRYRNRFGVWISHIYVDNSDSVAGGREIWGLPKELAAFSWEKHGVTVRAGDRLLCRLHHQSPSFGLRFPLTLSSFGQIDNRFVGFESQFSARFSLISGHLEVPLASPFSHLGLARPWLLLQGDTLTLKVNAPSEL